MHNACTYNHIMSCMLPAESQVMHLPYSKCFNPEPLDIAIHYCLAYCWYCFQWL